MSLSTRQRGAQYCEWVFPKGMTQEMGQLAYLQRATRWPSGRVPIEPRCFALCLMTEQLPAWMRYLHGA